MHGCEYKDAFPGYYGAMSLRWLVQGILRLPGVVENDLYPVMEDIDRNDSQVIFQGICSRISQGSAVDF